MKVLLYADFRSPHARGWRDGLLEAGIEVLTVSSERIESSGSKMPSDRMSLLRERFVRASKDRGGRVGSMMRKLGEIQVVHSMIQLIRSKSRRHLLLNSIDTFRPDLVHALRLPYEGITALSSKTSTPVIVSSWGQDFVPQARRDPILKAWLHANLRSAAGFQYDSPSDLVRARDYGFPRDNPTLHAAANFGVDKSLFYDSGEQTRGLVLYARKATANCNYFGFVEAALSLMETTDATFIGIGLEKIQQEVTRRYGKYDTARLRLIEEVDHDEFARLIRSAEVVVSPAYTDGMPITILDAAASGARIVAGELPQLRELVDIGVDIELIDPRESHQIARAIERQLNSKKTSNTVVLPEQYSRLRNLTRVREFYEQVLHAHQDELSDVG